MGAQSVLRWISFIASLVATAAFCGAFFKENWSVLDGYDQAVGPGVRFLKARIGPSHTCVTLARNATSSSPTTKVRVSEICYTHSHDENNHPTSVRDAQTNEWVTLPELCSGDREAVINSLGVPPNTGILDLWDRRCGSAFTIFTVFEIAGFIVVFLVPVLCGWFAIDDDTHVLFGALCGVVSAPCAWVCFAAWHNGINTGQFRNGPSELSCMVSAWAFSCVAVGYLLEMIVTLFVNWRSQVLEKRREEALNDYMPHV